MKEKESQEEYQEVITHNSYKKIVIVEKVSNKHRFVRRLEDGVVIKTGSKEK